MTNAFTDLLAATAPLTEDVTFERPPVAQVLAYADKNEGLDVASAWRLHPREARRMEGAVAPYPVAGFENLIPLIAGTDALEATHEGFLAQESPDVWEEKSDDEVRIELCEAFTRRIAPPVPAAAVGMALRMHPLFTLTVARSVGSAKIKNVLDGVITQDVTEHCAAAMFTTIGTIFVALSRLPEGVSVPESALADVVETCVAQGHRIGRKLQLDGIQAFSDKPLTDSAAGLVVSDLISKVLVPAGVAVRTRGNRIAIDSKMLGRVGFANVTQGELDLSFSQLFDVAPEGHRLH